MAKDFTFSIGIDGDVTVRSFDELIRWLEQERSRWAWMVPGDPRTDRHGLAGQLQTEWNGLIANVQALQNQGQHIEATRDYLIRLIQTIIVVSTTNIGATVLDIRQSAGDEAAMAAMAFLKQRLTAQHLTTPNEFLGMILSVIPDVRNVADWTDRLKRERTNYRMAARSLTERVEAEAGQRAVDTLAVINRYRDVAGRIFARRRRSWRQAENTWAEVVTSKISDVEKASSGAVERINATDEAYRNFMQLKAPVEYWSDKAKVHEKKEKHARWRLYGFFPAAIAILAATFILVANFLLSHPDTESSKAPIALYVVVSGGLLLLSTLLFWIGRLLTKLYLSEHHLRNDADERATMTTTYLALTTEGAAGEADRQIVLGALFRSTPDGIVKEDGPGDIGLQGLLAKLIAK